MKPLATALVALVLLAVLPPSATAQSDSVTLTPVRDNTLYETSDGSLSNGAGNHLFAGRTNDGSLRRALLAFDVAGSVPNGATVDSVRLELTVSQTASGAQSVGVHRVTADWGEGTSDASGNEGGGGASTPNDATWLHAFFDGTAWQTAGGDFVPGPSASTSVSGPGAYTWSSSTLAADVQGWLDAPATNFGWIVVGNESANRTAKRFDSRENPSAGARPALTVFYTAISTDREDPAALAGVRLDAAAPNPFTDRTAMTFSVDQPLPVSLTVYDLLGRRVAVLADGVYSGTVRVAFDASGLPGGVYVVQLHAGAVRTQRLVTLLR